MEDLVNALEGDGLVNAELIQEFKTGCRSGGSIKRDCAFAAGRCRAFRDKRVTEVRFRRFVATLGAPDELGGVDAKLLSSQKSLTTSATPALPTAYSDPPGDDHLG